MARSSAAQFQEKTDIPIGGITGQIHFTGDFGLLEPLLRIGEYVHLGKNVIFGLGRLAIAETA